MSVCNVVLPTFKVVLHLYCSSLGNYHTQSTFYFRDFRLPRIEENQVFELITMRPDFAKFCTFLQNAESLWQFEGGSFCFWQKCKATLVKQLGYCANFQMAQY